MTLGSDGEDSAQNSGHLRCEDISSNSKTNASFLNPTTDSASDNDAGERPVREKLKKTSIASIPKNSVVGSPAHNSAEAGNEAPSIKGSTDTDSISRGRSLRKRSLDELEGTEDSNIDLKVTALNRHVRKRSRDVLVGGGLEGVNRPKTPTEIPLQEVEEHNLNDKEMVEIDPKHLMPVSQSALHLVDQDGVDQEMQDSTLSPKKKRSRDQLDPEMYREQKIPATEEAKAQRSSEEHERDLHTHSLENDVISAEAVNGYPNAPDGLRNSDDGLVASDQPGAGASVNPFVVSSTGSLAEVGPNESQAGPSLTPGDHQSQTSISAFAASSFAKFSGSPLSPFGTLSATATGSTTLNSFGSVLASTKPTVSPLETSSTKKLNHPQSDGSSLLNPPASLSFGALGASAFTSSSASTPSAFAAVPFGSGFGKIFSEGAKLGSFAAPKGDAKWYDGSGTATSFGAPAKDEEENECSESDEEVQGQGIKEQESEEGNERFQPQNVDTGEDGEESVFSSPRVNLYSWNGTAWREGGRGTFKLNVPTRKLDDANDTHKTGRFIMRAHQTYRVLLNAPVFKQMKIGDSKGNEPSGKSLSFAVIEDGKPTPYLIKLGDEGESKTLYREVRRLQQAL